MEAIILAGGLGSRLRSVVQDLPKAMAPIRGKPFLDYLLRSLTPQGVRRVILATGYKHECIEEHFGQRYAGLELSYSRENTPLGTGGALQNALKLVRADRCYVLNGDTYLQVEFSLLEALFKRQNADLVLALKELQSNTRYGGVSLGASDRIEAFQSGGGTLINAGVSLINSDVFRRFPPPPLPFSVEGDYVGKRLSQLRVFGQRCDGYFIDIGVRQDLARAQQDLPEIS